MLFMFFLFSGNENISTRYGQKSVAMNLVENLGCHSRLAYKFIILEICSILNLCLAFIALDQFFQKKFFSYEKEYFFGWLFNNNK